MSTHASIARLLPDGGVQSTYLHFDGYPAGAHDTLARHYREHGRVEALLELGDLRSLASTLSDSESLDEGGPARVYASIAAWLASERYEYRYLWMPEGQWLLAHHDGSLWAAYNPLAELPAERGAA